MYVSVLLIRGVLAEFKKRGVDGTAWLRDHQVSYGVLGDLRSSVDVPTWNRMIGSAMQRLDDPGLGLSIGFGDSEGMLQLLDYMLLSSRTLHEAFELCVRYSPLVLDELRLELVNVGRRSHFRFALHSLFSADALRFGEDLIAAMAYRIGRHHTPEGGLPEVRLRQAEPTYHERFRSLFGCEVRFFCGHSEIEFDRELLFVHQAHADAQVVEVLANRANELLNGMRSPLSVVEQVRLLLANEAALFNVDARVLAEKMGIGPRLLQRKLREEGTSLRILIDESRKQAAFASLNNPRVSIKDAAERLGYSEPSAFHRAFKRWTSKTPADFRSRGTS